VSNYLEVLERAGLVSFLKTKGKGHSLAKETEKAFLSNTSLYKMIANDLNQEVEIGTIRECFVFNNLLKSGYRVNWTNKADIIVDSKYYFEVGGKNKTLKQIKDLENSYLIQDDINTLTSKNIPIYLIGFLY